MLATFALAAVFAAQSAAHSAPPESAVNAAYQELAAGETAKAIVNLERELAKDPRHPALLINLGAAYAREGRYKDAREAYQAALDSRNRHNLQLADGSWEDSRKTARLALNRLEQRTSFAVK